MADEHVDVHHGLLRGRRRAWKTDATHDYSLRLSLVCTNNDVHVLARQEALSVALARQRSRSASRYGRVLTLYRVGVRLRVGLTAEKSRKSAANEQGGKETGENIFGFLSKMQGFMHFIAKNYWWPDRQKQGPGKGLTIPMVSGRGLDIFPTPPLSIHTLIFLRFLI